MSQIVLLHGSCKCERRASSDCAHCPHGKNGAECISYNCSTNQWTDASSGVCLLDPGSCSCWCRLVPLRCALPLLFVPTYKDVSDKQCVRQLPNFNLFHTSRAGGVGRKSVSSASSNVCSACLRVCFQPPGSRVQVKATTSQDRCFPRAWRVGSISARLCWFFILFLGSEMTTVRLSSRNQQREGGQPLCDRIVANSSPSFCQLKVTCSGAQQHGAGVCKSHTATNVTCVKRPRLSRMAPLSRGQVNGGAVCVQTLHENASCAAHDATSCLRLYTTQLCHT